MARHPGPALRASLSPRGTLRTGLHVQGEQYVTSLMVTRHRGVRYIDGDSKLLAVTNSITSEDDTGPNHCHRQSAATRTPPIFRIAARKASVVSSVDESVIVIFGREYLECSLVCRKLIKLSCVKGYSVASWTAPPASENPALVLHLPEVHPFDGAVLGRSRTGQPKQGLSGCHDETLDPWRGCIPKRRSILAIL